MSIEISSLIALGSFAVALAALLSGVLYRLGKVEGKIELLIQEGKESRQETREMREEFLREMRDMREESRQEMRDMREESRQEMRDMREESRRNHQQLLQALALHTHDPDTGFAIFRVPPGMDAPAV